MDLNKFQLKNDGTFTGYKINDNSVRTDNGICVYFRNIEERLIEHINDANAVFGAVAWLTNKNILRALSSREQVQIIVQKEDFLRPDLGDESAEDWKSQLRSNYSKLTCTIPRGEFDCWLLSVMSMDKDSPIDPVRCVGYSNTSNSAAFPRMHNKFLVFANVEQGSDGGYPVHLIEPYAVWTGSFNFSRNATHSLENALYITDKTIVDAYFREYAQIAAISEKLDWTSTWLDPQWHIGM